LQAVLEGGIVSGRRCPGLAGVKRECGEALGPNPQLPPQL
jgi:hypothetical protein